jgi:hypothetical protein
MSSSTFGLSWIQAMEILHDDGYDTDGASPYGEACWMAGAAMGTTLFIDQIGQVFEEFPPKSCRLPA